MARGITRDDAGVPAVVGSYTAAVARVVVVVPLEETGGRRVLASVFQSDIAVPVLAKSSGSPEQQRRALVSAQYGSFGVTKTRAPSMTSSRGFPRNHDIVRGGISAASAAFIKHRLLHRRQRGRYLFINNVQRQLRR